MIAFLTPHSLPLPDLILVLQCTSWETFVTATANLSIVVSSGTESTALSCEMLDPPCYTNRKQNHFYSRLAKMVGRRRRRRKRKLVSVQDLPVALLSKVRSILILSFCPVLSCAFFGIKAQFRKRILHSFHFKAIFPDFKSFFEAIVSLLLSKYGYQNWSRLRLQISVKVFLKQYVKLIWVF